MSTRQPDGSQPHGSRRPGAISQGPRSNTGGVASATRGRATAPQLSGSSPPSSPPRPERHPLWSTADLAEILAGAADPTSISLRDRKGFTAPIFATLEAARARSAILDLVRPPEEGSKEASRLDAILELLQVIAESQTRIEQRLRAVESRLSASSAGSPNAPPRTR